MFSYSHSQINISAARYINSDDEYATNAKERSPVI